MRGPYLAKELYLKFYCLDVIRNVGNQNSLSRTNECSTEFGVRNKEKKREEKRKKKNSNEFESKDRRDIWSLYF